MEQSRKNPETKSALSLKPESFKDESLQLSINKPAPMLEIEIPEEPLKLRNINTHLTLEECEDFLKKQIQDLRPDTLEPDIVSYPPIAVNNRTQETSQVPEDFLKKQIQDINPETSEPENLDNVTQVPTLERSIDRETPVESTALRRSNSSTEIDSDTHQIHGQNPSANEVEDVKKNLRYYLRRGGRFAVEKN